MFGSEVLHFPTEFKNDVAFGSTCHLVQHRFRQFVARLAGSEIILHTALLHGFDGLFQALQRELPLCHKVVEFGNGQLKPHILLESLFVIRHFDGCSQVLHLGVISVTDAPYIGRNNHQFGFLNLCACNNGCTCEQHGKDCLFHSIVYLYSTDIVINNVLRQE